MALKMSEEHPQKVGRMKGTNPTLWYVGDYTYTKKQLESLHHAIEVELYEADPVWLQRKAGGE